MIHEKYPAISEPAELLPLAFQIMRFKMQAWRRKTIRRGEYEAVDVAEMPLPDHRPDPAMLAEREETKERLARALQGLGERCRELFRLKLQGRSFQEIQSRMGANSINTIYTWDARCRKQLMEAMGGRWEREQ